MRLKLVILVVSWGITTSIVFSKENPWHWTSEQNAQHRQEMLDETHYFVHQFSGKPALYMGDCGKGDQTLLSHQVSKSIRNTSIKKIIEHRLKENEEFTSMLFRIDAKDLNMNIVDQSFIRAYCSSTSKMSQLVYLDGYEIDIQDLSEFSKVYIVEKVHLKPEI